MEKEKVTCPQCGAQATPGRFCEYCGTKIPSVNITASVAEEDFNSWYDVLPQGYEAKLDCYINGDYKKSKFLVVTSKDNGKYGIINQKGKFVVDCNNPQIILYVDNYDYIVNDSLWNAIDGVKYLNSIKIDKNQSTFGYYTYLIRIKMGGHLGMSHSFVRFLDDSLYDRHLKKYVQLPVEFLKRMEDYNFSFTQNNSSGYTKDGIKFCIFRNIDFDINGHILLRKGIWILNYFSTHETPTVYIYNGKMKYENGHLNIISERVKPDDEVEKEFIPYIEKQRMCNEMEKKKEKKDRIKNNIIDPILLVLFLLLIVGLIFSFFYWFIPWLL